MQWNTKNLYSLHSCILFKAVKNIDPGTSSKSVDPENLRVEQMIFYPESKLPLFFMLFPVYHILSPPPPLTLFCSFGFLLKGDSSHTPRKLSEVPLK